MAEKASKPKAKARPGPPSVLATLPSTRPERLGKPRNGAAKPAPKPAAPGPQAVSPASEPLQRARPAEPPPNGLGVPKGAELVTTTIRAAGELAQIGLTVGGQTLKSALRRLPHP